MGAVHTIDFAEFRTVTQQLIASGTNFDINTVANFRCSHALVRRYV